jgi:hypothetical protein
MDDAEILERANALLAEARDQVGSDRDVELLVLLLHRTAVELNKSARAKATSSKGTPEWGAWAGLQNTTRALVLQASTCRDIVRKLRDRDSKSTDAENNVSPG